MKIYESGEMYLETVLILSKKNNKVRSIDISNYMEFSKPSVSRAVNKLKDDKLINIDKDGYITLTPLGLDVASKIYERHEVLSNILVGLGINKETAIKDACKIEHDISDETFKAIKKHLEKNKISN